MIEIKSAELADAEEIWKVQQAAFLPEGELYQNHNIYALSQTVDGVREDFSSGPVLKAVNEKGEIVGSVRARPLSDGAIMICKLAVKPGWQRQRIGTRLLQQIEGMFPNENLRLAASYTYQELRDFYEREGWEKAGDGELGEDRIPWGWWAKNRK
jgi:predicted N-acetyltransferase YhbS